MHTSLFPRATHCPKKLSPTLDLSCFVKVVEKQSVGSLSYRRFKKRYDFHAQWALVSFFTKSSVGLGSISIAVQ